MPEAIEEMAEGRGRTGGRTGGIGGRAPRMSEAMLEGVGKGKAVGLEVGKGRPGMEMLGILERGMVSLRSERALFGLRIVEKRPPAPGAEMRKVVILLIPRKPETMSEKGPEI